jgi:hypothetical protein
MVRKREESILLIKAGYSPGEVAKIRNVTPSTVEQNLSWGIGEGQITRTEIINGVPKIMRDVIDRIIETKNTDYWFTIFMEAKKQGVDLNRFDLKLYLKYTNARVSDAFHSVISIESALHRLIKASLIEEFDIDWWEKGIPLKIRKNCIRRDKTGDISGLFHYTTFRDLYKILERDEIFTPVWFLKHLGDKTTFLKNIEKTIQLRNNIFHPVKTINLKDDDYVFLTEITQNEVPKIKEATDVIQEINRKKLVT